MNAVDSEPIFCDECHAAVRLQRRPDGERELVCACGVRRAVAFDRDDPVPLRWGGGA